MAIYITTHIYVYIYHHIMSSSQLKSEDCIFLKIHEIFSRGAGIKWRENGLFWGFILSYGPAFLLRIVQSLYIHNSFSIGKILGQSGISDLSRVSRRKTSKLKTPEECCLSESVARKCILLLFSVHPKCVASFTQASTIINKITCVVSLMFHISNWTVGPLFTDIKGRDYHHILLYVIIWYFLLF